VCEYPVGVFVIGWVGTLSEKAYPRQFGRCSLEVSLTTWRVFVNKGEEAAVMFLIPPVVAHARID